MNNILEKNNHRHRVSMRGRSKAVALFLAVVSVLAIISVASPTIAAFEMQSAASTDGTIESQMPMQAGLGILGLGVLTLGGGLREQEPAPGEGGGGGGDEGIDPTAKRIIQELADTRSKMEAIEGDLAAHEELKQTAEDFDRVMKDFDGHASDIKALNETQKKLKRQLSEVRREVSGDPMAKILGNPEVRDAIAAQVRVPFLKHNNKRVPDEMMESYRAFDRMGEQRDIVTGSTPGSNLVDDQLLPNIYQLIAGAGVNSNFDVIPTSTASNKLITDTTDPEMLGVDEGAVIPESSYANAVTTISIEEFSGLMTISNSMIEDDTTSLVSRIVGKYVLATARRADFIGLQADGTDDGPNKNQTGAVEAGTAFVAASGNTTFQTVDYDDIINMFVGAGEGLDSSEGARIFIHPQALYRLLQIKDGDGRPLFQSALEAPTPGALGSILGVPVIRSYQMPSTNAASKPFFAYGDPKAIALGIRRNMDFASSADAKFTSNSTVFRATARMGVVLRDSAAFEVMTTAAS